MEKVLVTGLSGMVGSGFASMFGKTFDLVNLDITNGVDITKSEQVNQVVSQSKANTLIHLAAFTNVSAANEQRGDKSDICYQVNVIGTQNIARACQKYGKYMIHISTDFVFDGTKLTAYTEDDIPHPIEWYGETKYLAEIEVKNNLSDIVILRLAYPYQKEPIRPDFVANMRTKMQDNTLPPQFGDHTVTPTLVDDVAEVFSFCIKNRPTGLYHMVGSSWHTDLEMAQMVKKAYDIEVEIKPGSLEAYLKQVKRPYQKTMKVSNAKLANEFGIKMKTFNEGLETIKRQLNRYGPVYSKAD